MAQSPIVRGPLTTNTPAAGTNVVRNMISGMGAAIGFSSLLVRLIAKGDSIMKGNGGAANPMTYYLTNLYVPSNYLLVTNAGVGSQTLVAMEAGFTNEIHFHLTNSTATRIVIFQGGINDLYASTPAATLFAAWSNYVVKVHNDGGLLAATTVTSDELLTDAQDAERLKFNDLVRASPLWDYLIDSASAIPSPPNPIWYTDDVHYTDFGYDRWAFNTSEVLKRPARNSLTLTTGAYRNNVRHGISGAMVLGAVTVTDTGCTANTRYFFSAHTLGTISIPGGYYASTRTPSTSFVITSSQATETSTIDWMAVEP